MTDFPGTEQELWDRDAIPEEERDTLIFAQRAEEVLPDVGADPPEGEAVPKPEAGAQAAVQGQPPASVEQAQAEVPVQLAAEVPVDSVARFIAETGLVQPSAERELNAPRRSLAALELLDADDGSEASDLRANPLPPALPADAKPSPTPEGSSSPSTAARSSRGDVTERVTTIPRTHPMANSIAPGGSPLSAPPISPRRAGRWQVVLGIAALLMIGIAARLLQSRGEHHAASGARGGDTDEAALEGRRAAAAHEAEQAAREAAERAAAERAAAERAAAEAAISAAAVQAAADQALQANASTSHAQKPGSANGQGGATAAAERAARRRVRVGVGGAQLLDKADAEAALSPEERERARIVKALGALTPRLRDCVGDDHGIADVTITVRAPGIVSHALVHGPYAGSDKGSCIARALRSAKLPSLQDPVSRIEYPFQL